MRIFFLLFIFFIIKNSFAQPIEPENYKKYSGASLISNSFFNTGTYTFKIKSSNVTGTIFCAFLTDFEVNNSDDFLKHIELGFELLGENTKTIKCVAVLNGRKYHINDFKLGFDAAAAYHIYTIVQQKNVVKWLVDGKLIWSLPPDIAIQLCKPMRLFLNFRPAVSHCDKIDGWGCIRNAILPANSYIKQFKFKANKEVLVDENFKFNTFHRSKIKDKFSALNTNLWDIATFDLIKGNKPLYKKENIVFGNSGLRLQINRD